MALLFSASLSGCFEPEKSGVSYAAYNHTDKSIVSIIVNGEGGILGSRAHGGGGEICCVVIPNKWRPGLKATIKWQQDDIPVFDTTGKRVIRNGIPVVIESPWKEKNVEVSDYGEQLGRLFIHFLPRDEVKVAVSLYGPGHPNHPYRFDDTPLISP